MTGITWLHLSDWHEGAEEKLVQLSVGLLERLGIGSAPWERTSDNEYIMPVSTANQLPSGVQAPAEFTRSRTPAAEERWSDDDWGEPELVEEPLARTQKTERYRAATLEEEDNWGSSTDSAPEAKDVDYREVSDDTWPKEKQDTPYQPQPLNIPQKKRVTEYEEELDY